ncbi:MAG: ABC transporter substrate-binding protein [Deinococcales bacterium]
MKRALIIFVGAALLATVAFAQTPKDTYVEVEPAGIKTLDPARAYDTASAEVIQNVYETLYFYKGASNADFVPVLATDYKISPDGKTYTYTLRQGVTFHNGDPMTCMDVAYSIKRALVTNNQASGDWILAESLLGADGDANSVLGKDATDAQYHDYFQKINNSVTCPDPYTAVFHLVQPDPTFFARMMFSAASIMDMKWAVAHGQWDGTEATWKKWIGYDLSVNSYTQDHMNGTGPYELVQWVPGQKFVAKAYANYWGPQPAEKNVLINYVNDTSSRILAIQKGNADYMQVGSLSDIKQLEGSPGVKIWNLHGDQKDWSPAAVNAVFLNQDIQGGSTNPNLGSGKLDQNGIPANFFSDRDMRLCFSYAFDRQAFIQQVDLGLGQSLTMALPPSFLGYDPNIPKYTLDLEKAKQHCQAAWDGKAWQNGFKVTLFYNTGNTSRQTVDQIIKSNIEYLNPKFHVDVRGVAWPTYLDGLQKRNMPAFALGWAPDYADPADYIPVFYDATLKGQYAWSTSYNSPQIIALDKQAGTSTDAPTRALLYKQIGAIAHQDEPFILYPTPQPILVTRSDLKGVYYNALIGGGLYLWKDISK